MIKLYDFDSLKPEEILNLSLIHIFLKLNGSIELAPILGLSDVIVDIVETGTTLRENGLKVDVYKRQPVPAASTWAML